MPTDSINDSQTGCPFPTPHHRQKELARYLANQHFSLACVFRALAHFLGENTPKDSYGEHETTLAQEIDELLDQSEPHEGGDRLRNLIQGMATVVAELPS